MNSAAATTDVAKSRRKSSTKSKNSKQQQPSEVDLEVSGFVLRILIAFPIFLFILDSFSYYKCMLVLNP